MFFLETAESNTEKFKTMDELKEFVEEGSAEAGGFDWISEIRDNKGNKYGCNWNLEIVEI